MNWGDLVDLKSTFEHVTARYYSKFFFPGWETIKKQITFFVASIGFFRESKTYGVVNSMLIYFWLCQV